MRLRSRFQSIVGKFLYTWILRFSSRYLVFFARIIELCAGIFKWVVAFLFPINPSMLTSPSKSWSLILLISTRLLSLLKKASVKMSWLFGGVMWFSIWLLSCKREESESGLWVSQDSGGKFWFQSEFWSSFEKYLRFAIIHSGLFFVLLAVVGKMIRFPFWYIFSNDVGIFDLLSFLTCISSTSKRSSSPLSSESDRLIATVSVRGKLSG